ncbi:beta-lactamase class A [Sphingomonas naasensis]|uniref:Beta-lactamase n=1 Tax=Sphingomonas naasensis TaxID=1344951 RepID=A0A4S1WB23_9SPHN|nr:class A beta-lactamase [Sphingomonas naasensis]NIJ19725.1 beta-lactamase class A [Sphingomonas naasensis]TGX40131.1 class A beta-lactamase [Sphingomonas naasensis]
MDRRTFLWASGCAVAATSVAAAPRKTAPARFGPDFRNAILAVERASGGKLGLAVIDTGSGERFGLHADQRFPMCSTFKLALGAAILKQVEAKRETLARRIPVAAADIVSNSPFSEKRAGGSASVGELCHATITVSDNTAANLLLRTIGGPAGFTRRLRAFGDPVTRLDRWETAMGEGAPGDMRDTTTPDAMADLARRLVLGGALAPTSRAQLIAWLKATRTGLNGIRAALPEGWQAGDKTGTGGHGTDNQVAVLWRPRGAPLVVASYFTGSTLPQGQTRPLHAQVGRAIVAALG